MTRFVCLLFAAVLTLTAASALADPPRKNVKEEHVIFTDQEINGIIRRPTGVLFYVKPPAEFDKLLYLKKSFLPELHKKHIEAKR